MKLHKVLLIVLATFPAIEFVLSVDSLAAEKTGTEVLTVTLAALNLANPIADLHQEPQAYAVGARYGTRRRGLGKALQQNSPRRTPVPSRRKPVPGWRNTIVQWICRRVGCILAPHATGRIRAAC